MPLFGRLGSARLHALGGAFHALVQGADALLSNPSGLSSVQRFEVGLHHESWLADINQESLYGLTPVSRGLVFGAYAHTVDYGSFVLRDHAGKRLGELGVRDYAVGAALGLRGDRGFSGGLGLRASREDLLTQDLWALGIDAGVAWEGGEGWSGGLAAVNVGTSINGAQGAESVRWGVARKVPLEAGGWFWPALGFSYEPRGVPRVHLGGEWRVNPQLDLRAGFQHRFVETLIEGVQGLSLGLGFRFSPFVLDYAYLPYGDLGAGHRLSLGWRQDRWPFALPDRPKPAPTPTPEIVPVPPPEPAPSAPAEAPNDLRYGEDPLAEARHLEQSGRLGEALAEYERVAQARPELAGAWRGLADLAYQMKLRPKALAAYEKLLDLEPDSDLKDWLKAYRLEPGR